jgi:hypothetical protein
MPTPNEVNAERTSTDDRHLIDRIAAGLRPAPLDAVRQVQFRVGVEERLERGSFAWWPGAVLVLAAAALAVVWLSAPALREAPPAEVAGIERSSAPDPDAPVLDALLDPDAAGVEETPPEEYLPQDYLVLASYLDGTAADL